MHPKTGANERGTARGRARLTSWATVWLVVGAASWVGAGDETGKPPVNLREAKIRDAATTVSVPLGPKSSLVLGLHEGFWVQCPRYLPVPTSLAGDGLILQYLLARGGAPSLGYVGSEPLLPALEGETAPARAERSARGFVDGLAMRYERVEWRLAPGKIALNATTLKIGGKKTSAWRTARYSLEPAAEYGGPRSTFTGECALFHPDGTDRLAYVALDAKSGGTTLDRMLQNVSVQATTAVNPSGRVVQLNNLFEGEAGRFPVRLLAYESPAGFVLGPSVLALPGELVYAEDRLDTQGKATAWHRIEHRPADKDATLAVEAGRVRASFGAAAGPLKEVALATAGARAHVFRHAAALPEGGAGAATAVIRHDDLTLLFTWTTLGDTAQADKDAAAFERLLATMQLAVRW
jgi:hypothetical protein